LKVNFKSSIRDIKEIINGEFICGNGDGSISFISTDSRDIDENSLFIPLIGEKFDGHTFLENLVAEQKISAFLSMENFEAIIKSKNITGIKCDDTLFALGQIASAHRKKLSPKLIGITGTNGKTTSKEILYDILKSKFKTHKNEKNYNNEIGVPFTLLALQPEHEVAIVEMGMNHSGELDRLSKIAEPHIALITNVGEGHLEHLGTVENVALSKSEILNGMSPDSLLIINRDTAYFDLIAEKADKMKINIKTFGLDENSDFFPTSYKLEENGILFVVEDVEMFLPVYGIHNLYNVLGAIGVARELGLSLLEIKKSILEINSVEGRSQIIKNGFYLINDTYNSNPLSSRYALQSVNEIFSNRRKIAVLSDMLELGESSANFHFEIGKYVANLNFDLLCLFGEMAEEYQRGALKGGMNKSSVLVFESKKNLSNFLLENLTDNDIVLVKGSRSTKMEEIVNELTREGK